MAYADSIAARMRYHVLHNAAAEAEAWGDVHVSERLREMAGEEFSPSDRNS